MHRPIRERFIRSYTNLLCIVNKMRRAGVARHVTTSRRPDVILTSLSSRYSRRRHGDVTSLTTTPHDVGVVTSSSRLTSRDSHKTLPVTSRQRRIVVVGYRSTPLPRRHGIPDDVTSDVSVAATLRRHCNVASVTRNN